MPYATWVTPITVHNYMLLNSFIDFNRLLHCFKRRVFCMKIQTKKPPRVFVTSCLSIFPSKVSAYFIRSFHDVRRHFNLKTISLYNDCNL